MGPLVVPSPQSLRRLLSGVRRRLRDWRRGETRATFFDVTHRGELVSLLTNHGIAPFTLSEALASPSAEQGRRVARRVWEMREDLRKAFPLGLTPAQREAYAGWLLTVGRTDFGLTPEGVIAYLSDLASDPAHGLVTSYLWQPAWQRAVPHALTRFGWSTFTDWLTKEYQIAGRWIRRAHCPEMGSAWDEVRMLSWARPDIVTPAALSAAQADDANPLIQQFTAATDLPRPDRAWLNQLTKEITSGEARKPGINMLAHYRYPSGLQVEAVQLADSLTAAGFRVTQRDIPVSWPCDVDDQRSYDNLEVEPVSFLKIGAFEFFDEQYRKAGLDPRPGVYRIAGWSWELEQFPLEPVARAGLVNEIWTPSEFCAEAVRNVLSDRPVHAMMPGVTVPQVTPRPRSDFGLRDDRFLFLFLFDMGSVMERKNPLGLIRAFRQAFSGNEPVQLAIKVSRGQSRPDDLASLQAAGREAGVVIINRVMSRDESFALMDQCDCYVSLHRAEGFGLTVAEAMLLGKPVIATDYSATTEFLNAEVGLPVRYRRVALGQELPPYPADAIWADPDEADAAEQMRWVYEHPAEAKALGSRARQHAATVLSPKAAGERMNRRLREILADLSRGSP